MRVLMISGDRALLDPESNASKRLSLQRSAVEDLTVSYWGRGDFVRTLRVHGSYDVVTSQDPLWRGFIAWYIARKRACKLNIQVHGDLRALSPLKRTLARYVLNRADSVRVVSAKIKEQVLALGVKCPVHVLPIYVDVERFSQVVRQPSVPTVLWVGRFEREKDPMLAIDVFRMALVRVPQAQLILIGEGSLRNALEKKAEGLPVKILPWSDPVEYMTYASVVLSTSPYESFGASIVEALAAKVPVVSRDVGVAQEAGATVATKDELADVLSEALAHPREGRLLLTLLPQAAWASAWRATLT